MEIKNEPPPHGRPWAGAYNDAEVQPARRNGYDLLENGEKLNTQNNAKLLSRFPGFLFENVQFLHLNKIPVLIMTARVRDPAKSSDMFVSTIYVPLATILACVSAPTDNLGGHLVTVP